jgi:NAD-dependent SIR2 family protein deacetylase
VAAFLKDKKKILILTGAGISAASGIPTFRGNEGFWKKEQVEIDPDQPMEKIDPQILLTSAFYSQHP